MAKLCHVDRGGHVRSAVAEKHIWFNILVTEQDDSYVVYSYIFLMVTK